MLAFLLAAASVASFDWFDYRGRDPVPDAAPGHYRNPILQGFYPDPSITRVGDDYYLVTSTFAWFPGIPVFHSRDLVSWTQIGNAIDRPGQLDFAGLGLSRGVFAPAISWHRGTFYIVNTCVDCGGNFVITASDPRGPWSDPVWLPDLAGAIDPSLVFDPDAGARIVFNAEPPGAPLYDGHRALWMLRFDPSTLKTGGERTLLLNGGVNLSTKPVWIEGPHIFRHGDHYFLIAAEGGTAEGHSQVVLRSHSIDGPYQPYPGNPILTQRDLARDRPNPITSAGHADFVDTAAGEWWATFLAVRPYRGDYYNTGRETFLMPVRWVDGWPRITDPGEAIPWTAPRPKLPEQPPTRVPTNGAFALLEDFSEPALPPHWMMMRQPSRRWWRIAGGRLHLEARPVTLSEQGNPSFLARRQQHRDSTATTLVRFVPGDDRAEAGLAAFHDDDQWYLLAVGSAGGRPVVRLKRRSGPGEPATGTVLRQQRLPLRPGAPVRLRIVARGERYDFQWSADGRRWRTLAAGADGTLLSSKTSTPLSFVGSTFGLYAYHP